jgi:predicted nucleic acid-binding protein
LITLVRRPSCALGSAIFRSGWKFGESDPGEQQAIQLAQEEHADLLLMDERRGVALARRQGLEVTGTLGVLMQAGRLALVDIDAALSDLQATDFRSTPELFEQARARGRARG